jgi:lysophospholipase L1-like esterase
MPDTERMIEPPERIRLAELMRMLSDPSTPDEKIAPYLMLDPDASGPFQPVVRINPDRVEAPELEAAVLLSSLNGAARRDRLLRYREKIKSWSGTRVVAEGDSWFQYPFLLQDIVDQLDRDHAVFCLSAAGDLLADIIRQDELVAAIRAERPHAIIISAGGNDLLGGQRLRNFLEPFHPSRPPAAYLGARFGVFLDGIIGEYRRLLQRVVANAGTGRVFCHGYAYAVPTGGRWLGRPMSEIGITDAGLQRGIVRAIVDRFHEALVRLLGESSLRGRVVLVDCRTTVPANRWHDELHPTNSGFSLVAERFRAAIRQHASAGGLEAAPEDAPEPDTASPAALSAVALELAGTYSDDVLYAEIGRRTEMVKADPMLAKLDVAVVPESSLEGVFENFHRFGAALVDRIQRELHSLLCTEDPASSEDRRAVDEVISAGRDALAGYLVTLLTGAFALPATVATVVAAILIRRFARAGLAATCSVWKPSPATPE